MSIKYKKHIAGCLLIAVALFGFSGCRREVYTNPYEGMVLVSDGMGGQMWVRLYEELPASSFEPEDFYPDGEFINYRGEGFTALRGIDVSEHQRDIDWQAVAGEGVEFAIIRAGFRGYSEGLIYEDEFFRENIEGAIEQGIKVGVYFFSQAINTKEAREEARFLLELIDGYDLDLPVFYDWEYVSNVGETRADELEGKTITDNCLAFTELIEEAGYEAGVYFYRGLGYAQYELDRLGSLIFWAAAPADTPDFYYAHRIWQYSFTAKVEGIDNDTDLNLMFLPKEAGSGS
ncbi:MAG: hypothetical protein GX025_02730 [Clostridiales bacterium]|jgi:lysozyme|nr:hypothetical protein [Clostridiales bacterium]